MADTPDFLDRLHADLVAVLESTPSLANATIVLDDEGDLDAKVLAALQTRKTGENDKRGLVIVVLRPDVVEAESNLPGPVMELKLELQVIEQVMYNRDPVAGVNVTANQAAVQALAALHLRGLGNRLIYAKKDPIKSLPVTQGHLSRSVVLFSRSEGIVAERPVPPAGRTNLDGLLVLSHPFLDTPEAGKEVRYTADGSFPTADNSTLYTAPIDADPGTIVRAAAWSEELGFSDLLEATF